MTTTGLYFSYQMKDLRDVVLKLYVPQDLPPLNTAGHHGTTLKTTYIVFYPGISRSLYQLCPSVSLWSKNVLCNLF